jgi:hypothetical protein
MKQGKNIHEPYDNGYYDHTVQNPVRMSRTQDRIVFIADLRYPSANQHSRLCLHTQDNLK